MNAPIRITTPELDEIERIAEEQSRLRAEASLARFIADYEARTGKPFRDPEPTPEELEKARAKADAAMMGLTRLLLTDDELRSVGL